LPLLLNKTVKAQQIIRNPLHYLAYMLNLSDSLMFYFEQSLQKQKSIYIITGRQREGKTSFLKKLTLELKTKKITVSGFLALGIDKNNERQGFELENIETGEKRLLCDRTMSSDLSVGRFSFDIKTFSWGEHVFKDINNKNIAVIDEIGSLELENRGWNKLLTNLLRSEIKVLILVVRKDLTLEIINKWNLNRVKTIAISEYKVEDVIDLIIEDNK